MTTSKFIGRHLTRQTGSKIPESKCRICGANINSGFRDKDILSAKFNDFGYIRYDSDYICCNCAACLSGDGLNGKALRNYSFICYDDDLVILDHKDLALRLMYPASNEGDRFVFIISLTKKKHIFYRATINKSIKKYIVSTENNNVQIDETYRQLALICQVLYDAGFSKEEIKSGKYRKLNVIEEFGIKRFQKLDAEIRKFRHTTLMDLTIFAMQKETENDQD